MPLSSVNLTLLSLVSILQPPSITSRSTGEPCPTFFLRFLIFSSYFSAVRAHGGLVIADEVLSRNIFPFSKNSFSESDRSWPDWRAHVGLPKLWSGPRYCHHWTFHVQRLSYGCCDMFQVDDKSFHLLIFSILKGGVRTTGRILLHIWRESSSLRHRPHCPGGDFSDV